MSLSLAVSITYLCKFIPQLIKVAKNFCMDFRWLYVVHISENSQDPPPQHSSRIRMPTNKASTSNYTAVVSQELTAVCKFKVFHFHKLEMWPKHEFGQQNLVIIPPNHLPSHKNSLPYIFHCWSCLWVKEKHGSKCRQRGSQVTVPQGTALPNHTVSIPEGF